MSQALQTPHGHDEPDCLPRINLPPISQPSRHPSGTCPPITLSANVGSVLPLQSLYHYGCQFCFLRTSLQSRCTSVTATAAPGLGAAVTHPLPGPPARPPCSSPPAPLHPPRGIFVKRLPTHLAPCKLLTVAWRGRASPSKARFRPLPLTWSTLASLLPLTGQSLPHRRVLAPALSPPQPALALAPRPVGCPRSPGHHSEAHPRVLSAQAPLPAQGVGLCGLTLSKRHLTCTISQVSPACSLPHAHSVQQPSPWFFPPSL